MMTTADRSRLVSFCDRVSKLENVYIVAKQGPNKAKVSQVWRMDSDDPAHCWDTRDLFDEICERYLQDPSDEYTYIQARRLKGGDVLDKCNLSPLEGPPPSSESDGALTVMSHSLTRIAEHAMDTVAFERMRQTQRYDKLIKRHMQVSESLVELRTLDKVGAHLDELENDEGSNGEILQALAVFGPALLAAIGAGRDKRKRLEGPASPQPAPAQGPPSSPPQEPVAPQDVDMSRFTEQDAAGIIGLAAQIGLRRPDLLSPELVSHLVPVFDAVEVEVPQTVEVEVPDFDGWTPAAVEDVVALVEDVATHHIDMITDEHLARLIQPLQGRVAAYLFGA